MKSGTSFLLGVIVGLGASAVINRVRLGLEDEHPDRVYDRLNDSLEELEKKARSLETRLSSN